MKTEHIITNRVRYEETDQMGVVYYANYFIWFEMARTELFRVNDLEYKTIEEQDNLYIPVIEASCKYKVSLKYDDLIDIHVKLSQMTRIKIIFEYTIKKESIIVATGITEHVFTDHNSKIVSIPKKIKEHFSC